MLLAVTPREFELTVGQARIRGLEYGDPALRPLVLVHGIRDHGWSLDPIARAFAAEYRVVVPHLRGHGDSEPAGSYAMADLVGDLAALVDARSLSRPVLVGHSLGGQIVAQYAGIFDDVPAALVCIEGLGPPRRAGEATGAGRRELLRERIRASAAGYPAGEALPDLDAAIERFRQRNPSLSEDRARFLVERGTEPHPSGGLRWKWDPDAQKVWTTVSPDENEERWGWVRCPVLIVTASDSARYWTQRGLSEPLPASAFEADLRRKIGCFADAESVVIEAAGHMVHFDQPDTLILALRDFLKRRLV